MAGRTTVYGMLLVGVIFLSATVGGCLQINAPKEVKVDAGGYKDYYKGGGSGKPDEPKVSKDEAYKLASNAARDAGVRLEGYDTQDKDVNDNRWVFFERKRPRRDLGWKNNFAVRVSKKGDVLLYRGGKTLGEPSRKKIEKDDAYEIAKDVARDQGVRLNGYDIHDKKIEETYWVIFEKKQPDRKDGWKNHFTVRVSFDGTAVIYDK